MIRYFKFSLFIGCFFISTLVYCEEETTQVCALNAQASKLAQLVMAHPGQQRVALHCNQQLATIAQQRAEQLAKNKANPDITPNQVLIKGGFRIPNYYPVSGNQVEAVARDIEQAEQVIKHFDESVKHHDHVMGKDEFFGLQSQIGVGFYHDDDPTTHSQWVVLLAEPWRRPTYVYKQAFNMPFRIAKGCEKDWQNGNDEFLKRKCRRMGKAGRKKEKEVQVNCGATSCEHDQ